jgi:hypothetical protein
VSDLLDILISYVPGLILRRVTHDSSPITTPTVERFATAALLADISGFTAGSGP